MNINESIRDKRKFVKKLGGIPSKLPIYLLLTIVDYKTWFQIKVKACILFKLIIYTNYLI